MDKVCIYWLPSHCNWSQLNHMLLCILYLNKPSIFYPRNKQFENHGLSWSWNHNSGTACDGYFLPGVHHGKWQAVAPDCIRSLRRTLLEELLDIQAPYHCHQQLCKSHQPISRTGCLQSADLGHPTAKVAQGLSQRAANNLYCCTSPFCHHSPHLAMCHQQKWTWLCTFNIQEKIFYFLAICSVKLWVKWPWGCYNYLLRLTSIVTLAQFSFSLLIFPSFFGNMNF